MNKFCFHNKLKHDRIQKYKFYKFLKLTGYKLKFIRVFLNVQNRFWLTNITLKNT